MKKIDPMLKKIIDSLGKSIIDKKIRLPQTLVSIWPQYTLKEIQNDESIYQKPTSNIPILSKKEFKESLKSKNIPQEMIDNLVLIDVKYRDFSDKICTGQIIVNKVLKNETKKIFKRILTETDFRVTSIIPLSSFDWNSSMKFNNSGAFDWRFVSEREEVSDHAFGTAIDINPLINPWIKNGEQNKLYNPKNKGSLYSESPVVKIFKELGWKWGGDWKNSKDYQHFYRPDISLKHFGKEEFPE